MKQAIKRWWVSWHQLSNDHRPLTEPPGTEVAAWWCSGSDDVSSIMWAIVHAQTESCAQAAICKNWDSNGKEIGDWRFVQERKNDWLPGDRFLITKNWERERLGLTEVDT